MRIDEKIYYGYLQECDLCHNEYPIHKCNIKTRSVQNIIWIEFNGKQFLCNKCRREGEEVC